MSSLSRESSKDTLDTIKEIHKLLDSIELKQVLSIALITNNIQICFVLNYFILIFRWTLKIHGQRWSEILILPE